MRARQYRSRPRRRRRRVRWLVVALLAIAAIVAYVRLTDSTQTWRAIRGPVPYGEGRCGVALSPDRRIERTVCVLGATTMCFSGRRQLVAARRDCAGAREALVGAKLLP